MNTHEQDRTWAQQVLGPADPASEADVAALVEDTKREIAGRVDEDRSSPSNRSQLLRAVAAVAAALALFLAAMPVTAGVTDPAWAVEQSEDGRIRVEYSSTFGHGPDPEGLVAALQERGIDARISRVSTVWPLSHGRVVGIVYGFTPREPLINDLPDPARYGIEDVERGLILDPGPFRRADGTVIIKVGQAPWAS